VATYAPFGTPVTPSGTEKFKYAGEMLVGAAGSSPGLYYIGARWMDPELGRFISLDPQLGSLSAPQSMNRYVYCVNNPLRFTDPTGEFSLSKWWDKHWKEVAIVALCVAAVVTAGALAPVAFAAIGIQVSATACIASGLVGGAVSAGITYASSGGKASFSEVMKSFVIGGVASAFMPGIGKGIGKMAEKAGGGVLSRLAVRLFGGDSGPLSTGPEGGGWMRGTDFLKSIFRVVKGSGPRDAFGIGGWNSGSKLGIGILKSGTNIPRRSALPILEQGLKGGGPELMAKGSDFLFRGWLPLFWPPGFP